MQKTKKTLTQKNKSIDSLIIELRNQQVILDSDVAAIYGVETRDINKAVKNNLVKFPKGYIIELSKDELENLRWKDSTAKLSKNELESLRWKDSTAKLSKTRTLPKAFTEKGLYMLATILKSEQATRATIQIVETFAKIREFSKVAKTLATEKDAGNQKKLIGKSGQLIGEILNQEFAGDTSSETTIELNLAMIKIKHTVKRGSKK